MGSGPVRFSEMARSGLMREAVRLAVAEGRFFPVRGVCMRRVVPAGALVKVERCSGKDLLPGDVALVEWGGVVFLHRYLAGVKAGGERLLISKGDEAGYPDGPFPPGAVLGRLACLKEGDEVRRFRPGVWERVRAFVSGLMWAGRMKAGRWAEAVGLRLQG